MNHRAVADAARRVERRRGEDAIDVVVSENPRELLRELRSIDELRGVGLDRLLAEEELEEPAHGGELAGGGASGLSPASMRR